MELTLFIAKLLGVYMIIVGLFYLLRPEAAKQALRDLVNSAAMRLTFAAWAVIIGLAIVIGHPVFTFDAGGLVTVIGALILLKGILGMFAPDLLIKCGVSVLEGTNFQILSIATIALGALLSYCGWN